MERVLMTIGEWRAATRMGRTKTLEEIASSRIRVVRIGRSVRIPADELPAYVDLLKSEAGFAPKVVQS
jgi:excisionase family DNA binding protein